MIFTPTQLGIQSLPQEELLSDKKQCRRIGPCGIGSKALYLNSFYIDRHYYVPVSSVSRVFKRVAMSKGGYTGKGIFASIPYLVVVYDGGKEKQCIFKYEDQVDQFLESVARTFPEIKTVSEEAEKRLQRALAVQAAKKLPDIPLQAKQEIQRLELAKSYLEAQPEPFLELSSAARKKRTYEQTKPSYKWGAMLITLFGAVSLFYGVWSLMHHGSFAMYFVLFGMAALFLFSGANVMPTRHDNQRAIEKRLSNAERAAECRLQSYPGAFPVPACYAHPATLKRMIDVIQEGRAVTAEEALQAVKEDLKKLNAQTEVSQEEYDEIIAIKPLFLIRNYA